MDRVRITDNGDSDFTYRHPLDQRSSPDRCDIEDISSEISSSFSGPSLVSSPSPSIPPLPPSCSSSGGTVTVVAGGVRYIVHRVTKMDTLAGVAIKYGVEVADIKRINSLVTDRQMFAHKSLHIPLPGRHPPSPNLSNGYDNNGLSNSEQTIHARRRNSDLFETFQTLKLNNSPSPSQTVSPAMNKLQGYYGLKPELNNNNNSPPLDGCEMFVYSKGSSSTPYNPPLSINRKSKSLANGLDENGEQNGDIANAEGDSDKWGEKLLRRRQKSEADFTSWTPVKEDNSSGGGFSATAGKGLALRSKPGNRNGSGFDTDAGWLNHVPLSMGDSIVITDSLIGGVGKSSSGSSLQDQDSNPSSSSLSIWSASKWSLKSDLQAFSSAAISKPIFDGLPNPITGRKNKAALD